MLTLIIDLYHAVDIFYNYAIPYELKNYSKCKMHQTVYSYIAFGQINRIFLLTPIHYGIFIGLDVLNTKSNGSVVVPLLYVNVHSIILPVSCLIPTANYYTEVTMEV